MWIQEILRDCPKIAVLALSMMACTYASLRKAEKEVVIYEGTYQGQQQFQRFRLIFKTNPMTFHLLGPFNKVLSTWRWQDGRWRGNPLPHPMLTQFTPEEVYSFLWQGRLPAGCQKEEKYYLCWDRYYVTYGKKHPPQKIRIYDKLTKELIQMTIQKP